MDRMPGLCRGEPSCPYYVHEDPDRECIDGLARLNRRARWNGRAKVLTTMVKPGQLARNSERIAARQHAPEFDVQVPEACTYYGPSADACHFRMKGAAAPCPYYVHGAAAVHHLTSALGDRIGSRCRQACVSKTILQVPKIDS
jgi:hypothetical protein